MAFSVKITLFQQYSKCINLLSSVGKSSKLYLELFFVSVCSSSYFIYLWIFYVLFNYFPVLLLLMMNFCICLCRSKSPAVRVRGQELIYDFCWYPHMSSANPETCCMISTSRDNPIHLWDSLSGLLRCTYRAFDDMVKFFGFLMALLHMCTKI